MKTTWSFSAFTVLVYLVYYAITNLAALCSPAEGRHHPRWVSVVGLLSCLLLAFFVETTVWLVGLALLAAGLIWFAVARRLETTGA